MTHLVRVLAVAMMEEGEGNGPASLLDHDSAGINTVVSILKQCVETAKRVAGLGKAGGSKKLGLRTTIRDAMAQCVGNAAKALVPSLKDPQGAVSCAFVAAGGIEVLIDLLHFEGPGRKNVAIVIARLAGKPENMVEIRRLRGMEILMSLKGSLM
jgi:hypothetical protein